jgi:hypothetical protein
MHAGSASRVPLLRRSPEREGAQPLRATASPAQILRTTRARGRLCRGTIPATSGGMSTKAQDFRYAAERTNPKKPKQAKRTPPAEPRLTHNDAHRADHKATYAIETTGKHHSRKSTRKSSNRSKPDSAMRITARIENSSPEARATQRR